MCIAKLFQARLFSHYISIISDGTPDVAINCQMAVILRYVLKMFLNICKPKRSLADCIETTYHEITGQNKKKLSSLSSDGANYKWQTLRVKPIIKEAFMTLSFCVFMPTTNKGTSSWSNQTGQNFIDEFLGITIFFSHSPPQIQNLDKIVGKMLPSSSKTRLHFHSTSVLTIFENKNESIQSQGTQISKQTPWKYD